MYNEEYENRGFPFRDFLLKLILVIIFVFLLVWLLPKFIKPTVVENSGNIVDISALTSQIFAENLDKMKEAAITYYTDERLPQEVGKSHKMTLSDMIGKKIITPLIDKNNKPCDVEGSYVEITKMDDEYLLKVNLKDSEKEDYILVHLGCYTYCDSYVCEKEETKVVIKGSKPEDNVVVKPQPDNKPEKEPEKQPEKEPEKEPEIPEDDEPTPTPTPTPTPDEEVGYLYEYQKVTGVEMSDWSKWAYTYNANGQAEKISCDTPRLTCSANDPSCLLELKLISRKEKIGTHEQKYEKEKEAMVQTGSYEQKACSKYNYVIIDETTYVMTTSVTYTTVTKVSGGGSGWSKGSTNSYANPPRDTATKQYVFAGADYSYCSDTCSTLPNFYYTEYSYSGGMSSVSGTTSTPGNVSSSTSTTVTAECGEYVTKTIPVYSTIKKSEIATRTEPLYGTVCYKATRTRTVVDPGKTLNKWSKYNDRTLLDNGWYYTGATKLDK